MNWLGYEIKGEKKLWSAYLNGDRVTDVPLKTKTLAWKWVLTKYCNESNVREHSSFYYHLSKDINLNPLVTSLAPTEWNKSDIVVPRKNYSSSGDIVTIKKAVTNGIMAIVKVGGRYTIVSLINGKDLGHFTYITEDVAKSCCNEIDYKDFLNIQQLTDVSHIYDVCKKYSNISHKTTPYPIFATSYNLRFPKSVKGVGAKDYIQFSFSEGIDWEFFIRADVWKKIVKNHKDEVWEYYFDVDNDSVVLSQERNRITLKNQTVNKAGRKVHLVEMYANTEDRQEGKITYPYTVLEDFIK